ncbi:YrdB family protein [Psychrobacillus sp.]|uniref:YrdB family protein n=1 Tax=Psychrobacillus sp. TaxID=1871623 RepID=UPI0028BD319E|nr:YrdB family protein [Psychrobacillus sp.]
MEICALAAFAFWGFHIDRGRFFKILFGIATPLIIAIFWGTFISPKATFPVTVPVRIILQFVIFAFAAAALYFSDKSLLALIFGVVVLIGMILMYSIVDNPNFN